MTVKYKNQHDRKFDRKGTTVTVDLQNENISVSLTDMPRTTARNIGFDLVAAMVCQGFDLEHDGETATLWLEDVDYGLLAGFGEGLAGLLEEICGEYGYDVYRPK